MGLSYAVQVIGPRVIAVPLLLTLGLALGACGSPSDTSALSPVGEPDRSGSTAITAPSGGSTSSSASDSRSPTPSASSDVPLVGAIAKDPSQDTRTNVAGTNQSGSAVDTTLNVVDASIPYGPERREQMADYALQRYGTRTSSLRPSAIVLHFTESDDNPWSTIGYFAQNQPNGGMYPQVCAHFVLGKDGTAYQLVPTDVMCRHTVGLNHVAIGIEVVQATQGHSSAWADQQILDRPAQLAGLLGLVRSLQAQWGIPNERIVGHGTANDDPAFLDLTGLRNDHTDFGWPAVLRVRELLASRS